jgi:hypothetical protein
LQALPLAMCKAFPCILSSTTLIVVGSFSISYESPSGAGPPVSDIRARSGPIPLNRMELSVRTECDQYPTRYKELEATLNDKDVESGPEK